MIKVTPKSLIEFIDGKPMRRLLPFVESKLDSFEVKNSSQYLKNLLDGVKDEKLRAGLAEIGRRINKEAPYDKEFKLPILEDITAMSGNLDAKEDKELIKEVCKLLDNYSDENSQKTLYCAERLVTIALHAGNKAVDMEDSVYLAYKELAENNKLFKSFLKILKFFGKRPSLDDEFRKSLLIDTLSPHHGIGSFFSKELKDKLYDMYYVAHKPPKIGKVLKEIKEKYGTYVFLPNMISEKRVKEILKEFEAWQKAGGEKVKYEKLLDYCHFHKDFNEGPGIQGYATFDNLIRIRPGFSPSKDRMVLRHERTHINDLNRLSEEEEILYKKPMICEELKRGGLSQFLRNYALTSRSELLAVASTGDMSKYSDKFKKLLTKYGMPEWMFNLEK